MKKSVLSLFVLLSMGLVASAQTEKGNWLVGGNISLNTASQNTQIAMRPSAGYFFLDNFAAGANLDLSYSKFGSQKVTSFGIGPFARYYFGTTNIRPLVEADLNFISSKTSTTGTSGSATENGTGYFLGGGLAAFLNRNVALEGLAGYDHISVSGGGSGGFSLRIGFQVYLSKAQVDRIKTQM